MSKYGEPEIYSRFLKKEWVKENNSRIHSNAFIPDPKSTTRLEISCFETQMLSNREILQIAINNNITPNQRLPFGHCSIAWSNFLFDKLQIDRNYIPERHIDIVGWEKYNGKEEIKCLAMQLAEISSKKIHIYEL